MFIVKISVVDKSVKQSEKWCLDREFRCPDSLGRELLVPCVSAHPSRHARQGVWVFGCPDIPLSCPDTA